MPPSGLPSSDGPEVTALELTAGVWHTAVVARRADMSGRHAESVTLDRVLLVGASLAGARLDALRLLDVRLIGCDLSELSPPWDVSGMTAKLAVRLFLEVLVHPVHP